MVDVHLLWRCRIRGGILPPLTPHLESEDNVICLIAVVLPVGKFEFSWVGLDRYEA